MLKRFLAYYKPHMKIFTLDMLASLMGAVIGIVFSNRATLYGLFLGMCIGILIGSAKDKKLVWFSRGGHSHLRINNTEAYDRAIVDFFNT